MQLYPNPAIDSTNFTYHETPRCSLPNPTQFENLEHLCPPFENYHSTLMLAECTGTEEKMRKKPTTRWLIIITETESSYTQPKFGYSYKLQYKNVSAADDLLLPV